jgi:hypothetical protein
MKYSQPTGADAADRAAHWRCFNELHRLRAYPDNCAAAGSSSFAADARLFAFLFAPPAADPSRAQGIAAPRHSVHDSGSRS